MTTSTAQRATSPLHRLQQQRGWSQVMLAQRLDTIWAGTGGGPSRQAAKQCLHVFVEMNYWFAQRL
jgi:hypothetical protein